MGQIRQRVSDDETSHKRYKSVRIFVQSLHHKILVNLNIIFNAFCPQHDSFREAWCPGCGETWYPGFVYPFVFVCVWACVHVHECECVISVSPCRIYNLVCQTVTWKKLIIYACSLSYLITLLLEILKIYKYISLSLYVSQKK